MKTVLNWYTKEVMLGSMSLQEENRGGRTRRRVNCVQNYSDGKRFLKKLNLVGRYC